MSCTSVPTRKWHARVFPRVLSIVALCVAAALPCQAQQQPKPTYEVSVLGIRGTNANKDISPELRSLVPLLRKQFKYTGFKLEKKGGGRVEEGKSSTTTLIEGYKVKVSPLARTGARVKLKVEGFKREKDKDIPMWNTTVTIDRGRYHLQARPLPNGDGLIIAISAR